MARPRAALEAARNASSGFRRRLSVFLSSDAVRRLREGRRNWLVGVPGLVAGVLLILSDFTAVRYIKTIEATCQQLAQPTLRDSCLVIGHESHGFGFVLLGLLVLVMTYGAALGGSRPAAVALLVAGVLGLGIALLHDLPQTTEKGEVGVVYADAKAHKGIGFWFGLIGSSLALASGAFATWRTPQRLELRRASAEPAATDGPTTEPSADAEEPASA